MKVQNNKHCVPLIWCDDPKETLKILFSASGMELVDIPRPGRMAVELHTLVSKLSSLCSNLGTAV